MTQRYGFREGKNESEEQFNKLIANTFAQSKCKNVMDLRVHWNNTLNESIQ